MFARLTGALAVAALSATAMAQSTAKAGEDQPVTRTQISDKLDADYADLDADKDGKVDSAEIKARLTKGAEADLAVIRKERDAAFAKFDTDNNGSISKAEFDAHAKLPTIREAEAKPFLDKFDANKDGSISKDEFRAPTIANFEKLDANKDGTLSVAEQKGTATPAAAKTSAKKATVKETPPIGR